MVRKAYFAVSAFNFRDSNKLVCLVGKNKLTF